MKKITMMFKYITCITFLNEEHKNDIRTLMIHLIIMLLYKKIKMMLKYMAYI